MISDEQLDRLAERWREEFPEHPDDEHVGRMAKILAAFRLRVARDKARRDAEGGEPR